MQPSIVKIKECTDRTLFNLPSSPISCILTEYDDETKVIYISNPKYIKGSNPTPPYITSAPYIAFTKYEYDVVEWNAPIV